MNIPNDFAVRMVDFCTGKDLWDFLNELPIKVEPVSEVKWLGVSLEGKIVTVKPEVGEVAYQGIEKIGKNVDGYVEIRDFKGHPFTARFYDKA